MSCLMQKILVEALIFAQYNVVVIGIIAIFVFAISKFL